MSHPIFRYTGLATLLGLAISSVMPADGPDAPHESRPITRTEAMTATKTITRDGFDLILMTERDGFTCRVFREGKDAPLASTLVADETKALAWFEKFLRRNR